MLSTYILVRRFAQLDTIGPLFLVVVVTAALLAIVVLVRINTAIAALAALFAGGTLAANLLSLLLSTESFVSKRWASPTPVGLRLRQS